MLEGQGQFDAHLGRIIGKADDIRKVLYAAADIIRVDARLSITAGSTSGKGHVASSPGEPPNADTHHLDRNIVTEVKGPLTVEVQSNASYSAALEYGTKNMAERPFMRPAVKRTAPKVAGLISIEIKKMVA